jgi:hypothetical protein
VELLTGNHVIPAPKFQLQLSGWLVSVKDEDLSLEVVCGSQDIYPVVKTPSEDLYSAYLTKGKLDLKTAHNARFSFSISLSENISNLSGKNLYLDVRNSENVEMYRIPLINSASDGSTVLFDYHFDKNNVVNVAIPSFFMEKSQKSINLFNYIISVYRTVNIPFTFIATLAYLFICLKLLLNRKKKEETLLTQWLLLTGILCTYLVLFFGLDYYITFTANISDLSGYGSGLYFYMIVFNVVSVCIGVVQIKDTICTFTKNKKSQLLSESAPVTKEEK